MLKAQVQGLFITFIFPIIKHKLLVINAKKCGGYPPDFLALMTNNLCTFVFYDCGFYLVNWFSSHLIGFNLAGGMQVQGNINLIGLISFIFQSFSMFKSAFKS